MKHPYFDLPLPIILGHRGAAGDAPENTLVSFRRGLELGAHIIESDVHLTRDGVPVLAHDDRVDRTTEGSGRIAELTIGALRELDAGYRFEPPEGGSFPFRGQGVRIPTLEEAFDVLPDARFNLELKSEEPGLVAEAVSLVVDRGREGLTLLTSGSDAIMARLRGELRRRRAAPALGASIADVLAVIRSAADEKPPATDSMALQIPVEFGDRPLITRELVAHAHAHGIQVHAWTINEPAEIERLLGLGVDGIVTDFPGRMAALLEPR
jgi:glycerophosphoryl diester phosphodiesterase